MRLIKKHLPLFIFLSIYFVLIAYKLISHPTPFYDWDEAINVEVSREMSEQKSFTPLWQGKAWLDKPPLPFLLFGFIMKLTPFTSPEISLRILALLLSLISLSLIYTLFYKASRNRLISLLTVIITSFTPLFLQRSQIVNIDVFLLIGWLGYLLFFENFWFSFVFLALCVLSKSLLGFYPVFILGAYFIFLFTVKKLKKDQLRRIFLKLLSHVAILAIWYIVMQLIFGKDFWQQHIIETHFKRVTASIESHFGQRTYYVDLLFEQMGILAWFSIIGFFLLITNYLISYFSSKRSASRNIRSLFSTSSNNNLLYSLFLLPWFLFLNLTKTKIFWYLYPAIPQFAFLAVYPLALFKNKIKLLSYPLSIILLVFVFNQNFIKTDFFTTFYSKLEDYQELALYAKDKCDSLTVLVDKNTRDSTKTLEDLELTISSTKQWGNHPSIVYYFKKKVDFLYSENSFDAKLMTPQMCIAIQNSDTSVISQNLQLKKIKTIGDYSLFKEIKTY